MKTTTPSRQTVIRSAIVLGLVCFGYWTYQVYQFGYNQRDIDAAFDGSSGLSAEITTPTRDQLEIVIRSLRRDADELERQLKDCRRKLETNEC